MRVGRIVGRSGAERAVDPDLATKLFSRTRGRITACAGPVPCENCGQVTGDDFYMDAAAGCDYQRASGYRQHRLGCLSRADAASLVRAVGEGPEALAQAPSGRVGFARRTSRVWQRIGSDGTAAPRIDR